MFGFPICDELILMIRKQGKAIPWNDGPSKTRVEWGCFGEAGDPFEEYPENRQI